jgi:hypothetical protein
MNKILTLLAAFIAVTGIAFADTMLTESLSVGGFIDMSYSDGDNGKESTSGIDQVEVDFTFNNGGPVTGQLDVEYENGADGLNLEEAYINYAFADGGILTVGRFETMLLQDASEPTGLYQYSNAYDFFGSNLNQALYDVGDQGIKYSSGGWAIALIDNGDSKIGDGNATSASTDGDGDYAYEIGYTGKLSDTVTGFIGARFYEDDANNNEDDAINADGDILNLHLIYEEGPWVVGGEFVKADYQGNPLGENKDINKDIVGSLVGTIDSIDLDLFSIFANYSYSEKNSVTFRYSDISGDANVGTAAFDIDADKLTLAHNSALSDDLALILEYSMQDSKHTKDEDILAVELLYAF